MILRRVIEHFRKQEWTAIFLDFVIVVMGVFVGMQVNNWNAEKNSAVAEGQLIERLKSDLRGMEASFREQDELAVRLHGGWIDVLRALEQCKVEPDRGEAMQFALTHYQSGFSPEIQRSAFDEMKATGAFSRLSDRELQNAAAELYSILDNEAQGDLSERANQLAADRILWKSVAFSFERDEPDLSRIDEGILANFNPLDHCDDLELRGAVWEIVDALRDWLFVSRTSVARIDAILLRLERTGE